MAEQLFNIKFVSEVEKYPCLYNYNLKEYSKKEITEKAWVAVGKPVNLTGLQAKEKWKNLRSVFVRNLKPPASGSSKKKKYYLADAMQFALLYIKSAGIPSGSLLNPNNRDNEPQASAPTSPPPSVSPPPSTSPPPAASPPPSASSPPSALPPLPTSATASSIHQTERTSTPLLASLSACSSQQLRRHKNKTSENDELFNDYLKTKMSKQNNVNHESINNNANKMFLLSLLPDLNCMISTQIRSFKRQVIDVIDNILSVPPTSSTQTPALVHIPNTLGTLSSQTSTFVVPATIQHPSTSSSQITTNIELPNMIEYLTDDGLSEPTYIQLLQNTVGDEVN